MARLIPNVRPEDVAYDSERLVLEALMKLPAPYVVLHSFPWLRPDRSLLNEPLSEGEADFVVVHPERGLLVVEVKGGAPELRGRTWYRSGKEMKDPFWQASRSRFALLDAIEARTSKRVSRSMFTHGDVVVFPHVKYEGALPLNTDERVFADATRLSQLPEVIENAFSAWQRRPTSLSPAQFDLLLEALMPKLKLFRFVGAELASERSKIVQVTDDQRATLQGLLASERVLVEGHAGSGKTLLALEFAVSLVAEGKTVLFLCYNRHLATWLNEQVTLEPRLRNREDNLHIATFHSYALALARRAGVEFEVPQTGAQEFWDSEVPLILEQALELLPSKRRAPPFDAVVVDEAQDFSPDWWVTIESLTSGGRSGRLFAFMDLNQSWRGVAKPPPVPLPVRFKLGTNCRNTRSIARSAAQLAAIDVSLLPGSPEGEPPSVRRATEQSTAGLVLNEVKQLLASGVTPQQIALIGPAAYDKSVLAHFPEVEGMPFVADAAVWRRNEGILVTTARAFKGLESDIVLLYDLGAFGQQFTRTDLYVAWTRARHRLLVYCYGAELRAEVERVLAQASATATQEESNRCTQS